MIHQAQNKDTRQSYRDSEGTGSPLYKQDEAAQDKGSHGLNTQHNGEQVNTIKIEKRRTRQ